MSQESSRNSSFVIAVSLRAAVIYLCSYQRVSAVDKIQLISLVAQ